MDLKMMSTSSSSSSTCTSSRTRSSLRDLHHHYNHPSSFSSSLLEEIYRSFDQEGEIPHRSHTMKKSTSACLDRENRFLIDRWISDNRRRPANYSSSSVSSSDSSSGNCGFSSSDTESLYGHSLKKQQKLVPPPLKPIRTTAVPSEFHRKSYSDEFPAKKKKKKEGNLQRKALKLYGDLKKVKQPISPGGKLASFINSLFTAGASKKPKITSSSPSPSPSPSSNVQKLERELASRSCLSKTPSSAGRYERRSVRFVDEERSGHVRSTIRGADVAKRDSSTLLANDEEFKLQIREKHRRVEEMAKELLKNYHNRNNNYMKELMLNTVVNDHGRKFNNDVKIGGFEDEDEEEEEEDDVSCCSSDLFELENLLDIGAVDRELPVYETTRVDTSSRRPLIMS